MSGDEESDDNEDGEEDINAAHIARSQKQDGDTVIKTGYLLKKGERRKVCYH